MESATKASAPRATIIDTAQHSKTITLNDAVDLLNIKNMCEVTEAKATAGANLGVSSSFNETSVKSILHSSNAPNLAAYTLDFRPLEEVSVGSLERPARHGSDPIAAAAVTVSSKVSLLSSIVKRMSLPRRGRMTVHKAEAASLDPPDKTAKRLTRHSKIRRWFTQRITKPKATTADSSLIPFTDPSSTVKNNGHLNTSTCCTYDHPSLQSTGKLQSSSPITYSLLSPNLEPTSIKPNQPDPCNRSNVVATRESAWNTGLSHQLHSSSPATPAGPLKVTPTYPSPRVTENNNDRFGNSDRNKSRVHFSSHDLQARISAHPTSPLCSLSDANLVEAHAAGQRRPAVPPLCTDVPSYLSISLAAFGYSIHSSDSWLASDNQRLRSFSLSRSPSVVRSYGTNTVLVSNPGSHQPVTALPDPASYSLNTDVIHSIAQTQNKPQTDPVKSGSSIQREDLSVSIPRDAEQPSLSSPCHSPSECTESSASNPRLRGTRTRNHTAALDDQEHWQRSSLIMFAVAQASPRPRTLTGDEDVNVDLGPETVANGHLKSESEIFTNGTGSGAIVDKSLIGAPHSKPIEHDVVTSSEEPVVLNSDLNVQFFIREVNQAQASILASVEQAERDLESELLDNEISGLLRTAVGKARLLISEKFVQFRGLCQQSIDWENSKHVNCSTSVAPLPTLLSDLDGFWEMVKLQIADIWNMFEQIDHVRANGWKPGSTPEPVDSAQPSSEVNVIDKPGSSSKPQRPRSKVNSRRPTDDTARQKARERLEAVKREMRSKKLSASTLGTEDGFVIIE